MTNKEDVFVNEKIWRNMNPQQLEDFTLRIFEYYRETGFPYYPTNMESRQKDFDKFMAYDRSTLFDEDVVKQSMHALGLAWSYFPNSFDVRCGDMMTPFEAFMDDEIFMKVIQKRLKMGTYMSDSGIRKMLKIYTGVQAVSNFRPTAAAAIYDVFGYAKEDFSVWDMSGGWGGRLLGAIASGVKHYYATEPSENAFNGLHNLAEDFAGDMDYVIFKCGSESWQPEKNMFDLCFTSPPYFDLEKYSDEDSQSYKKFPEKDKWINEFLLETFKNCYRGLKPDGAMLINIADIKGNELEGDMIVVANSVGFKLRRKFYYALSNVNLKNKEKKFKYEPIYLFTK